ncbi:MAG: hypothetical protein ACJAWW_001679 [Sulfurimonas sp.]|jgi:hypothetical protein
MRIEMKELEELVSSAITENNAENPDSEIINTKLQDALDLIQDILEDEDGIHECD